MQNLVLDVEAVSSWDSLPEHARATLLASHARAQAKLPMESRGNPLDDPRESAALSPWTSRVVSVAIWDSARKRGAVYHDGDGERLDEEDWSYHPRRSERGILTAVWGLLEANAGARVVTYNGRNYDGPMLMTRSVKHRARASRNLVPYRYSTREHLDLCDVLGFWGVARSVPLDVVAGVLGLKSSKGGMCGAEVGRAYEEGRIMEIARYNAADVELERDILEVWEETVGAVFQERQKWA